jgi:Bacterial SCP ortholog
MRDPVTMAKVKGILQALSDAEPGHAVEVRIPPYSAIQCGTGPKHTRGTPPNVVEMKAETLFALVAGEIAWRAAVSSGEIHASGERSDLSALFEKIRMHL